MAEYQRVPENVSLVGGGVTSVLAYAASYRSVIEPHIPGGEPVKLQVAILGLILLAMLIVMLYQIDTRQRVVRNIADDK